MHRRDFSKFGERMESVWISEMALSVCLFDNECQQLLAFTNDVSESHSSTSGVLKTADIKHTAYG